MPRERHFLFVDAVKAIPLLSKAAANKKCKQRQLRIMCSVAIPPTASADHERSEQLSHERDIGGNIVTKKIQKENGQYEYFLRIKTTEHRYMITLMANCS
jgi:hypothetical protein